MQGKSKKLILDIGKVKKIWKKSLKKVDLAQKRIH